LIQLESVERGVILPVKAHASARQNGTQGEHDGALKVSVTQAPEKGKANKAIIAVLAKQLSLRKAQFELISGDASPHKRFLIADIDQAELRRRIDAASS